MQVVELIKRGALYHGSETAVYFENQQKSYTEVYENSNRLANALYLLGLKKGDRIAFLLANSLQSVEIDFAILLGGFVRVPLNTRLSLNEHAHMVKETEAKILLFTQEFRARAEELKGTCEKLQHLGLMNGEKQGTFLYIPELIESASANEVPVIVNDSDFATIQYTSGTTGVLKAATHTQQTWAAICTNILNAISIQRGDIMMHAAPLTHASGTLVLPHWIRGAANSILPGFEPTSFLRAVHETQPTTLNLVPTMVVMLLSHPNVKDYSFDSVRQIIYGASPMPREALKRGLQIWGPKFIQYYGQTESPLILTLLDASEHVGEDESTLRRLLSCGRPTVNTAIRIVNAFGEDCNTNEIGEIIVQSTQNMIGYWDAPELTEETIKEGWIYTRDMGFLDEEGYLTLVDRKSDMIISGGFNVYPREVEEVLYQHDAVLEAAVIGIPDEKWIETIKAYVVLKPSAQATEEELIEFSKQHLASYKKPSQIEFISELPKSAVGKVVRRLLKPIS